MKVLRTKEGSSVLLDPMSPIWATVGSQLFALDPAPIEMVAELSPFMQLGGKFGKVARLKASALHNGADVTFRLSWDKAVKNEIKDLNQFADAVALMFGMTADAQSMTMGSEDDPVNAWLWRAGHDEPFDVLAKGFGSSIRRAAKDSGLRAMGKHDGKQWIVTLQRPLDAKEGFVSLKLGGRYGVGFAAWDGGNDERAARKSISGSFVDVEFEG